MGRCTVRHRPYLLDVTKFETKTEALLGTPSSNLSRQDALDATCDVLQERFPNDTFRLTQLNGGEKDRLSWALRCKLKGKNQTLVCKVASKTPKGRERLFTEKAWLDELWSEPMQKNDTVPKPLFFDAERCVLAMEDAKGRTLRELLGHAQSVKDVEHLMRRSGTWLHAFHGRTLKEHAFDPSPHSKWLERSMREHTQGQRRIADYDEMAPFLERLWDVERGCVEKIAR